MASSAPMKQTSLDLNLSTRRTRKHEFLAQMQLVVPWAALVELIAPYYPEGKNGRPPFALETMLRVHFLLDLELPPFHGHLIVITEGVRDAQSQTALPGAISRADGRVGSRRPTCRGCGAPP